jgi:hypothetical protein
MDDIIDIQNTKPLISEGLYLLKEERFIESNKNIYKIGRSSNIYNRVNSYENGTIVYLIIECSNSEKNESELIKIFNKEFKNIKYYGSEYFQGELPIMKNLIINHIKKNASEDINLIDMDIKITSVDKETDLHIPKYKQEIYSKAKLSVFKIGEDLEVNEDGYKEKYLTPEQIIFVRNYFNELNINENSAEILIEFIKNYIIEKTNKSNLPINKDTIKCYDCGMQFAHKQSLNKHIRLNRCKANIDDFDIENNIENTDNNDNNNKYIKSNNGIILNGLLKNNTITNNIDNSSNFMANIAININTFGCEKSK